MCKFNKSVSLIMKEKEHKNPYIGDHLCDSCIHLYLNNNDKGNNGCRAFPNGIPNEAKCGYNHLKIIDGQIGDYVYQEAKYDELSPFGKYLYDGRIRLKSHRLK